MTLTADEFESALTALRGDLIEQGKRVRTLLDTAFDAFFTHSAALADSAIAADDQIDKADISIEERAVALLIRAAEDTVKLGPSSLRGLLTLVKVNNELERTADVGVDIAERARALAGQSMEFPPTTRVMTNSVLGILRDLMKAYEQGDAAIARTVLQSQDAVVAFKAEILRQSEKRVAAGEMGVDLAFDLHELASHCLLISDHASNVAEQVIYERTGVIVRHSDGGWVDVERAE